MNYCVWSDNNLKSVTICFPISNYLFPNLNSFSFTWAQTLKKASKKWLLEVQRLQNKVSLWKHYCKKMAVSILLWPCPYFCEFVCCTLLRTQVLKAKYLGDSEMFVSNSSRFIWIFFEMTETNSYWTVSLLPCIFLKKKHSCFQLVFSQIALRLDVFVSGQDLVCLLSNTSKMASVLFL